MPTYVHDKNSLIKLIQSLPNDCAILATGEVSTVEIRKKLKVKQITSDFALSAFKSKDGVSDLVGKDRYVIALYVGKRSDLSIEALDNFPAKRKRAPKKKG